MLLSKVFGGNELQLPTGITSLLSHPILSSFLPSHILHLLPGISWDNLPNKLFALEPLSQNLLLLEANLSQRVKERTHVSGLRTFREIIVQRMRTNMKLET